MTAVETARALRKQMTPQEAKVWLRLRGLRPQGFHFAAASAPLPASVVDFACLKAALVVEIDGGQRGIEANAARDRARDAARCAGGPGFRVLRFWNADVDAEPDAVAETIFARPR